MKFGIENIPNQVINFFNLSKYKLLKHSKALSLVKDFEGCEPTKYIHGFVLTVVDSIVRIFIENIQNRN